MKDINSKYDPSAKQMSLFSVLLSECRPPGVRVKLEGIQEGRERSCAWRDEDYYVV